MENNGHINNNGNAASDDKGEDGQDDEDDQDNDTDANGKDLGPRGWRGTLGRTRMSRGMSH